MSSAGRAPNVLLVDHGQPGIMHVPHWHAQVEVNFLFRGWVDYSMNGHRFRLQQNQLCIFWGGLPHQMVDTSDDAFFFVAHLPLIHFFRLHLPATLHDRLIHGATLVTEAEDGTDAANFERWSGYMRHGDPIRADHAINELLLRIERVRFEHFRMIGTNETAAAAIPGNDAQGFANISSICDYIAENFREDIDSVDIAASVDIHPKYAMSIFKKSTGMTINEYVNLLRLSYAQALLMQDDVNVLQVAMDSGFGSLSAFNKTFRKLAGMSPSDFRRDCRTRPSLVTHGSDREAAQPL
ncbi:helix-turn-helix domain-containing protein [Devosia rhodophyticola]|uniref:Helix-turn-helix domain-containing protein n=1 Tax=Devosia rhodophyticola TaxID=3026423 RepID=A0ABY7Z1V3_9HYPH|nr:helix-turn-helix domain-containing protein [Devosia rhodophyticola]WDR07611.1 helix-turn-helix domain-containing protein [Devosia rhodophyticola]